ncbi:MAG: N-acetyltransferase [Phenylobacterium sp.]|uniref:GNAT family N-acetyltransferase n=1 Tax=Phenylobacterium sp. TaxID=1871053 RepID=UPI0025EB4D6A|nr:N-acetyltransferase [Phenylobacterium sp.]MCA3710652.1 N-acetyltransferase [Phenylobacterium sp.]MCA3734141.1 N-acetyltransferase [Phenylobacterium sp.]MCA3739152.1 N-acetyltransferase [Phenylobacterium sp.]MCA3754472.1 N-acetyltransferase [Phenylobacterium sp.]MCA4915184.1 N-acetyltransferase [Phenylobacterium sp.]
MADIHESETVIRPETPADAAGIEALLDHAFGPGRFVKVSERVREFARFRPDLSFCAEAGGEIVGLVRLWDIHIGAIPALFLGPLAVHTGRRLDGLGGRLVAHAGAAADALGEGPILLVGDPPFFERFGYAVPPTAGVRLPGPVDPKRVLARGAAGPLAGPVRP